MIVRYLSHPQVAIDPAIPVDKWGLNEEGRQRVMALAGNMALAQTRTVISSGEKKAVETAQPLAEPLGLPVIIREEMHENDRSATGFLMPDEFEQVASQFFACPDTSIRGWERAVDAQSRIVGAVEKVLSEAGRGDVLIVGHGGVGTLLMCHIAGWPIAHDHDQPGGGGNVFAFEGGSQQLLHGWTPMERLGREGARS
ncbi:MAG: phosphoglycerate mutase family protein [Salaquimonas sp.]|nr:phosphoglycerate mutase family protein [Salaquimonas sp.]